MAKREDLAGGRSTNSPGTPQRNTNTATDTNTNTNFNSQVATGGPGVVPTDFNTSSQSSTQGYGNQTGNHASGLKEEARHLAQEAKEQTKQVASQAQSHVNQLVSQQKDQAAERLGGFAGALRDAANRLEGQEGMGLSRYAGQAAGQVDRFSNYLRQGDLKGFVRDAENLARRNPDLFLGGVFLAGVVLARFLKASDPRREALVRYEDGPQGAAAYAGFAGSTGGAYGSPSYTTERYPGSGDVSGRPYDPSPAGV